MKRWEEYLLEPKVQEDIREGLVKHFLDVIVMIELKRSSKLSGYDFIGFVQRKYGMLISSGTIYSLLYSMERRGLINGDCGDRKRDYKLTDEGEKTIKAIVESKDEIHKFIQTMLG